MVGVAQSRDPHRPVLQILQATYLFRRFRSGGEGKERQSSGRSKTDDLGAAGIGLKRDIERGAGVIHRVPDQRLHGDVAAAGIDQPDVKAFLGKMAARTGDLVGHDAKQLAAESEQHLTALSIGIPLGDEHYAAGQACQPFQGDSPADYFA